MVRISAHLVPFVFAMVIFALLGAFAGFFMGSLSVGAFFGAVIGVWVFVAKTNASRAVKDSPEGEDAGYIKGHGGGSGFGW